MTVILYILIAVAVGIMIGCHLGARASTKVTTPVVVSIPEVTLPDVLKVVIQQPPPPPAPMDRATLWQEVYGKTLDEALNASGASYSTDCDTAREAADAAVDKAFPSS